MLPQPKVQWSLILQGLKGFAHVGGASTWALKTDIWNTILKLGLHHVGMDLQALLATSWTLHVPEVCLRQSVLDILECPYPGQC